MFLKAGSLGHFLQGRQAPRSSAQLHTAPRFPSHPEKSMWVLQQTLQRAVTSPYAPEHPLGRAGAVKIPDVRAVLQIPIEGFLFENQATGFFKLPRKPPCPVRVEDRVPRSERGSRSPRTCSHRWPGPPQPFQSMGLAEDQGFASIHVPGCSDGLWATLEGTSALKPQSCYTGACKGPIPPADGAGTFLPCPSFWLDLGCPKMWARGWTGSLCVGEGPALAYMASSRLCV